MKVISDRIDGAIAFDKHALEGALSGIVVSIATRSAAATLSFINQVVHNQSKDYNTQFLNKVKEVFVADLKNSLKEFLPPIFQYDTSINIIAAAPVKTEVSVYSFPWGCLVGAREANQPEVDGVRHSKENHIVCRSL